MEPRKLGSAFPVINGRARLPPDYTYAFTEGVARGQKDSIRPVSLFPYFHAAENMIRLMHHSFSISSTRSSTWACGLVIAFLTPQCKVTTPPLGPHSAHGFLPQGFIVDSLRLWLHIGPVLQSQTLCLCHYCNSCSHDILPIMDAR